MSKDEQEAAATEAPKSKAKLMIIVLVALLLVGGGVGGYLFYSSTKATAAPKPGAVVSLDPITINLGGSHYLKLGLALQVTADTAETPDGSKALDLAIEEYTGMDIAKLSTLKGREHAKDELLKEVKEAYEGEVMDIYFTQFVTQ